QLPVLVFGHEDHTLRFNTHHLARRQVSDECNLFTYDIFRRVVTGNTAEDGAPVDTRVDSEFQKLVGFLNLFCLQDFSDAYVKLREIINGDLRLEGLYFHPGSSRMSFTRLLQLCNLPFDVGIFYVTVQQLGLVERTTAGDGVDEPAASPESGALLIECGMVELPMHCFCTIGKKRFACQCDISAEV